MRKKIVFLLILFLIVVFSDPAHSATYTHNNANQLTGIDYGDSAIAYTYDAKGNLVSMTVIDKLAPTGSIQINGGAANTSSTSVTLNISATDRSGTAG